jgi:ribosomal protein S18 acetylase RimI-like enzyme
VEREMMELKLITEHKQDFLPLLALADSPKFIQNYLERGELYVFEDKAVALVTKEEGSYEIQNFAVAVSFQGRGFGKSFMTELCRKYPGQTLLVRTDEYTAKFYEKCGFTAFKRVKNYFPEKYGERIFDKGRELIDNIYLKVELT